MFKTLKLKKQKLELEVNLLSRLYLLVDGFPDIIELAKRAKDLDIEELQKLIVSEIVGYVEAKKENETFSKNETVGE